MKKLQELNIIEIVKVLPLIRNYVRTTIEEDFENDKLSLSATYTSYPTAVDVLGDYHAQGWKIYNSNSDVEYIKEFISAHQNCIGFSDDLTMTTTFY